MAFPTIPYFHELTMPEQINCLYGYHCAMRAVRDYDYSGSPLDDAERWVAEIQVLIAYVTAVHRS